MNEIETFFGPIEDTADALRVFELCRQGRLGRVRRRLHEKERRLIRSGSVFVFDEQESGIRRWTDGRLWSPSRILGNFLIYRELERRIGGGGGQHGGGQNDPSTRHFKRIQPALSSNDESELMPWLSNPVIPSSVDNEHPVVDPAQIFDFHHPHPTSSSFLSSTSEGCANSLLGPNSFRLLKSKKLQIAGAAHGNNTRYVFKPDGLIKKTISARVDGRMQHLICYFDEADFIMAHSGRMRIKGSGLMEELRRTRIPPDLVLQQNFRKQPTNELGFPLADVASRKRRHTFSSSLEVPVTPSSGYNQRNDLIALDLASSINELTSTTCEYMNAAITSEADTTPTRELDPNEADPILICELDPVVFQNDPPQMTVTPTSTSTAVTTTTPYPSTNNIMEECIRLVLGGEGDVGTPAGLALCSGDPTLPIFDRPDSAVPFQ